jgi:benzoyl-CoA reductase/2-hydroxyglutaryl-CoA dehydratase subunit BcrC/BadD/HgdB
MMLEMMEAQAASTLEAKEDARALWYREWSGMFRKAFEPESKVAYTSAYAFPMELIAAFDIVPFDFEVAGAMISSTEMGVPNMNAAEDRGYAMDVCSFHRASLGALFNEYLPEPDILLTTSYYCDQKAKTNELFSLLSGKEAYFLYAPSEINKDSIAYVEKQLRQIASRLEEIAGHKLDEGRLKEAIRSSNRARQSRLKLMELQKHRPAPWGGGTLIGYSINGLIFTGTETMEKLNNAFIRDLEAKISGGEPSLENHRLYWFAWLPVYKNNLFELLEVRGIGMPLCETLRVFWDEIDEDNPFEGLALKCLRNLFVGPASRRLDGIDSIIDEYSIDGALLFATPACRHANAAHRFLKDSLAERGIPFLLLDMDISDPRSYSPEQIKVRIESFIELLDQKN